MKLQINESYEHDLKYAVLLKKVSTSQLYFALFDTSEDALTFENDAELLGSDVFKSWDPDIMSNIRQNHFDRDGNYSYIATDEYGDEFIQEIRVVNKQPIEV